MWTYPPTRILVPVDFGEASAHAVRIAAAIAVRYGARLSALHAESLEAPPHFTHDQIEKLERQRVEARTRATQYLAEFAGRLAHVAVDARLNEGPPVESVLEESASHDLVVMGTHGRRGPKRWWLGSVAERVVRKIDRPVLITRAREGGPAPGAEFRRVAVASSSGHPHAHGDRYARGLAQAFGGLVLDSLGACRAADVERLGATLLVIPRATDATGWLGETPEHLIRGCALPMLFVPEEGEAGTK